MIPSATLPTPGLDVDPERIQRLRGNLQYRTMTKQNLAALFWYGPPELTPVLHLRIEEYQQACGVHPFLDPVEASLGAGL